jgi:tetratricopeptide (TPR) repeat protein
MATSEAVLDPYVAAESIEAAERELDLLVGRAGELPVPLGDLYDELAGAAAEEDRYDSAARLQRKALEAGCRYSLVAREMLGWYLLKAGALTEGESMFAELCRERPQDSDLRITMGNARSDAGLRDESLEAFDEALAIAKRRGFQHDIDRARIERRAEREHLGIALDEDDRLAPPPKPLSGTPAAWAVSWFPPEERASALRHWPTLSDDFADAEAYARRIEGHLRQLNRELGQHPLVAPIEVGALLEWAASKGYDPDTGEARSVFAADLASNGGAIEWPPGRNDPCWCRSGRKYKRCCGAG